MRIEEIEQTLREKSFGIPFGNSAVQITAFAPSEATPERCYRHHLLQLDQQFKALHECKFRRDRNQIDIDEANEKLKTEDNAFERRRLEVLIAEKEFYMQAEEKLISDCLYRIEAHKGMIDKFPAITREQFEHAEVGYWQQRLLDDAKSEILASGTVSVGTVQAIKQIGMELRRNLTGQLVICKENAVTQIGM